MKRNVKWTVLAVAIAAASAAQAETPEPPAAPEPEVNTTINTLIDTNIDTDVITLIDTNVDTDVNTDINTTLNTTKNYTSDVNKDVDLVYSDSFDRETVIDHAVDTSYTDTVDKNYESDVTKSVDLSYSDSFDRTTTATHDVATTHTDDFAKNVEVNKTFNSDVDLALNAERNIVDTDINHDETVNIDHNIDRDERNVLFSLTAEFNVDSAAVAAIDNRQSVSANLGVNDELTNDASIEDDTASTASGNLQFNVAAGDNNVQDNAAALSAADASFAFGVAESSVVVDQRGYNNLTGNLGVTNDASIGDNAFESASGNIGVNVTSGNNNAQKNSLAASVATTTYASASIASNQVSTGNSVSNAPKVEEAVETLEFALTGTVSGTTSSSGTGSYEGTGNAYQQDNFYLDMWDGALPHENGDELGHLDMDGDIQNAVDNPYADGVGGIAFDTDEEGDLSYEEMGTADLQASLSGSIDFTTLEVVAAATNTATLSGSAFSGASGNIGVNVSAGTGNQQANSLSMAVSQPSTGGTTPPPAPNEG